MSALKRGEFTDNVKLMLWNELADVQPIALSEMPLKYLQKPNLRLMYMLKTFTIKQLDFMRREIFSQFAAGHYAKGTKNLAAFTSFWLLANGTADALKTVITGEQFDITDNMAENMLQMVAWSKYMGTKMEQSGPFAAGLEWLLPPTNYVDNIFVGAMGNNKEKILEPIPFVGKVLYKRLRERKKRAARMRAPYMGESLSEEARAIRKRYKGNE